MVIILSIRQLLVWLAVVSALCFVPVGTRVWKQRRGKYPSRLPLSNSVSLSILGFGLPEEQCRSLGYQNCAGQQQQQQQRETSKDKAGAAHLLRTTSRVPVGVNNDTFVVTTIKAMDANLTIAGATAEALERRFVAINTTSASTSATKRRRTREEEEVQVQTESHRNDGVSQAHQSNNVPSLHGRLLCASVLAYDRPGEQEPYLGAVAYRPGTTVKRLSKGVNSVMIGWIDASDETTTSSRPAIVISFRGTRPGRPMDWLQNAAMRLKYLEPPLAMLFAEPRRRRRRRLQQLQRPGVFPAMEWHGDSMSEGRVHAGFYNAARGLYEPVRNTVLEILGEEGYLNKIQNSKGELDMPEVYLTGHSKGGAIAALTAAWMKLDSHMPEPTQVVAFASPRIGDSSFQNFYDTTLGMKAKHIAYEAHNDVIPHMPPSSDESLSQEQGVAWNGMDEDMMSVVDHMLWSSNDYESSSQDNSDNSSLEESSAFVVAAKNTNQPPRKRRRLRNLITWDYQSVGSRHYIHEDGTVTPIRSNSNSRSSSSDASKRPLASDRTGVLAGRSIMSVRAFRRAHCPRCGDEHCNGLYMAGVAKEVCNNIDHREQSNEKEEMTLSIPSIRELDPVSWPSSSVALRA